MKLPYSIWLLCIYLALLPLALTGQQPGEVNFQHLGRKDGLAQSSVFAIAQDSVGYLWFGTRGGISRYDGYRFSNYHEGSAAKNDVRTLYVDPLTQDVWAGSIGGLSQYDPVKDKFITYERQEGDATGLSNRVVRSIFRDRAGRLWIGTSAGLNLLDETTGSFRHFYVNPRVTDTFENHINFVTADADDNLLLGTQRGLHRVHLDNFSAGKVRMEKVTDLGDRSLTTYAWDREELWLGTATGILRWSPTAGITGMFYHREDDPTSLLNNTVRTLNINDAGDLWVGTFKGLDLLRAGQSAFEHHVQSDKARAGLEDNSVMSTMIDKAGALWVGTYYGGVHHLDERYNSFTNYRHQDFSNSLSSDRVSSFAEESDGDIWIGTEGGGLNFLDGATGRFRHYTHDPENPGSLSGNNVKKILRDGKDLWIGTYLNGLNHFDPQTERFVHYKNRPGEANSLANDNVYGLLREGDFLWICTFGGGLDLLDLTSGRFHHYTHDPADSHSLVDNSVRTIIKDHAGAFWLGTEAGISRVQTSTDGLPTTFETYLPTEHVLSLHESTDRRLYVGCFSSGLYRYNPGRDEVEHFTTADGLPGNTIVGMLETDNGILWLSTDNGLSRFDPVSATFTNYNYSNGLENSEFSFNAYYRTRAGELLFGGFNGFTLFDPATLTPNTFVPPVVITSLLQNGEEVAVKGADGLLTRDINRTATLIFPYNEASFTLRFAALDYFSPESNHYAYKLEGLDRDWIYTTGKSEATYTIQREGDYTFLLKGGNSNGVWNERVRRIEIQVLPPFYRSWWAYLLYAGLTALAFYAMARLLRLRHQVQLQTIAKQQQAELTEAKLRFFTNITHELRTPLTLILGPLRDLARAKDHGEDTNRKLSLIERNAQRLLDLVNQVLSFRRLMSDHQPLAIRAASVRELFGGVFESFTESARLRGIEFTRKSNADNQELWVDRDKMELVFYNLLSNAFKFTPDGGAIHFSIEDGAEAVTFRIRDSGKGIAEDLGEKIFDRFYERSVGRESATKNSGIGLAVSRQMVDLHGGKIYVGKKVGEDAGAELVVELRKGKGHFSGTDFNTELFPFARPEAQASKVNAVNSPEGPPLKRTPAGERFKVLIVEDNPDIRRYVAGIFEGDYDVCTAQNGKLGLTEARKNYPDVIISDVMMPEMDGLEFCHRIKTDLALSHIPVILLTARAAEPLRIEGLRTGADDYLTKPFIPEELRLRVRNIIQARKQAREKFARVLSLDPQEITITNTDEAFLEAALTAVETHIGDHRFKLEDLASELAVSRSLLFTKVKALTGQTPNNFVKTVRLKRAAQLLESGQLNVSEVADRVGYRDPKYFRKVFKAHFNRVPSEYKSPT
ncbi:two-component regulator propeller domain-containing protein [Neolewinella antarctica]|uniref:histidine kinase n=1 Tax=Neolewinella antarctica TaxID=442734 RepID=A0ABX0XCA4_9BACT|nr:two-component regulator propeller domain-containing protein [Neolewinella antarctica]NJC26890.1 signal transduction histidine kinase/ligand-binding sensor domain-containing protein/DNA-binding response OmpR family regulator [Neolewinella antarctica]